jgi:hypothetical protein
MFSMAAKETKGSEGTLSKVDEDTKNKVKLSRGDEVRLRRCGQTASHMFGSQIIRYFIFAPFPRT